MYKNSKSVIYKSLWLGVMCVLLLWVYEKNSSQQFFYEKNTNHDDSENKSEFASEELFGTDVVMSIVDGSVNDNGLEVEIINYTDDNISFGTEFILEKKCGDRWDIINKEQYFNGLGVLLKAKSKKEKKIEFPESLKKGEYRVVKKFFVFSNDSEIDVGAEFFLD